MVRCYITDRRLLPGRPAEQQEALLNRIEQVAAQGVEFIQLREKDLEGRELFALTRAALKRIGAHRGRLLINDRLDVALAAGAAGAHLPGDGLPVAAVRRATPEGFFITKSCHSLEEAAEAARAGADACLLGPVFPTPTKSGQPGLGLEALRQASGLAPIWALGGITAENAELCRRAGAAGIAGIRYFQSLPTEVGHP